MLKLCSLSCSWSTARK